MEKLHTTSKIRKALMVAGATMALGGAMLTTNTIQAEASSWDERPLTEIQTDIQEVKESESIEYQIQWGDTLGNIAKALDMDLHTLANANGIGNIDVIIAGQYLLISEDAQGQTQVEVNEESSKPVTTQQTEVKSAPVEKAKPEPKPEPKPVAQAPVETVSGSEAEAKAWIAQKESNDNYNAVSSSGKYIGKFQLTNTYLNGDHSPENQERVAEKYVAERYGSWVKAKEFWLANGWY